MRQSSLRDEEMERKKPRVYTEEFKRQAVKLASDLGSAARAAKQLGISDANIGNWRKKIEASQSLTVPSQKMKSDGRALAAGSVEEENQRLRRKIAELEKVNYILKSAAAIFTRDHLS
jgi:transposase